jgi:hypothetical protein
MPVAVFAVLVSRVRVLLGLFMLPVGMMMGRLVVMVCGGVMVRSGLPMVLYGRMLGLLGHGRVLRQGSWGMGASRPRSGCGRVADNSTDSVGSRVLSPTLRTAPGTSQDRLRPVLLTA